MNILFITYDFPYPITSGGKNRAYHLLKHTAKKVNFFLYSFVREDYNTESNNEILNLGVKKINVFKRKKISSISNITNSIFKNSSIFKSLYFERKVVEDLKKIIHEENIDIVHYESSYTGFYISSLSSMHIKQVLGTENIEFKLYFDYANNMKKISLWPLVKLQANRLKNEEIQMMKKADLVTVITKEEVKTVEELTNVKSTIIANGIESDFFSYQFDNKIKNNILFVGNFTYFPNIDAVNFFQKHVFEKLNKEITVTIIGKKCNEKFKFEDKRIIKKDFVEDIISEYRNADILIFPIRIGGGTNFKVLEAMALGVPIVAHPDRLSGLGAIDGVHFLGATTGEEYKIKIEKLIEDNKLRLSITQNARKLIEENFNWKGIGNDLMKAWESLM